MSSERRLRELAAQQKNLVQLYYRDAISIEVLKAEQKRIKKEQAQIDKWQSRLLPRSMTPWEP